MAALSPFSSLTPTEFQSLVQSHEVKLLQKDDYVVRSYERMKYLYYVAKGDVNEEWKFPGKVYVKRDIRVKEYLGLGELYRDSGVEYTAVSRSVTCLYGFSISRIHDLM